MMMEVSAVPMKTKDKVKRERWSLRQYDVTLVQLWLMHVCVCVASICIECTRVVIFIKSSPLHRLFCSARAYSPWKHQQIQNPRQRWHSYHHRIHTCILGYMIWSVMTARVFAFGCTWQLYCMVCCVVYARIWSCRLWIQSLLSSYSVWVSNRHCRSRCCHRHRCYWFYPVEHPMPADAIGNGTYSHKYASRTNCGTLSLALSLTVSRGFNRISCTFIVLFINSTHLLALTLSHCEQTVKRGIWSEREEKNDWWGL